jgi:hypothetical protein
MQIPSDTRQAKAVQSAFEAERTYLLVTTKAKKPDTQPPELMTELHRWTSTVDELREANRSSPLFTHLSAVSEGIVSLGWIVEKRPADFVGDTLGGAQYYGNKILKEYKEKSVNIILCSSVVDVKEINVKPGTKITSSSFKHTTRSSDLSSTTSNNTSRPA